MLPLHGEISQCIFHKPLEDKMRTLEDSVINLNTFNTMLFCISYKYFLNLFCIMNSIIELLFCPLKKQFVQVTPTLFNIQLAVTRSKSAIETPKQFVKSLQS